jgi:formate-dependent nitrite reductase cytochrome c552 subunit
MLTNFPNAARLANIQCENCHGPNIGSTLHTDGILDPERISLSADVCGSCHGEPQRHARFQQWEDSGHGSYELAVEEGTSANCAGCHSAQGFMIFLKQLQSGNPLRSIPSGSITWTTDTVLPQTCSVCHDPHAQGTTSGEPNTATVRVEDNTPKLPGGFMATGVGRGAICIICHNSRNGGSGTDAFLHQDGDPVFGSLTSYSGPHEACQGDVVMGHNAYFVGSTPSTSSPYRSPHALIADTCATCHMELTPPPELLSYNLAGTNHSFRASLNICSNCHAVNQSLGPMLQATVKSTLEALQKSIGDKIISRNTGTPIQEVVDLGSRGNVDVIYTGQTTVTNIGLGSIPGLSVSALGTDDLAKALWNFYLIEQDLSFGVHNPDFTFAVLGASQFAVDSIPNTIVPSNEL